MEKFIPKEKLSKKEQKKLNSKTRKTWNGVSPVTRKPENKKKYNRKKLQKFDKTDFGAFCFVKPQERWTMSSNLFRLHRKGKAEPHKSVILLSWQPRSRVSSGHLCE